MRALQFQPAAGRAPLAGTGRRVQRFPLAGMRELRARRATSSSGRVSITLATWEGAESTGRLTLFVEDIAAFARAVAEIAASTPPPRRQRRDPDEDDTRTAEPHR